MVFIDKKSSYSQALEAHKQVSTVLDKYQRERADGSVLSLDSEGNLRTRTKSFLIEPIRRFFEEKFYGKTYDPEKIADFLNKSFIVIHLKVIQEVDFETKDGMDPSSKHKAIIETWGDLYNGLEKIDRALIAFQTSLFKRDENNISLEKSSMQTRNIESHMRWYFNLSGHGSDAKTYDKTPQWTKSKWIKPGSS